MLGFTVLMVFALMRSGDAAPLQSKALPILKVWTAGAMLPALRALAPGFEQASGLRLQLDVAPPTSNSAPSAGRRLAGQASADVMVMSDFTMAKLNARGQIVADSRVGVGKSFIAMAIGQGASRPDIHSEEAFKQAVLAADSIGYTASASGMYLSRVLFVRMGLTSAFQRKAHLMTTTALAEGLASGRVQVGFQELSELQAVPGIDIVGLIPDSLQQMTLYCAAVSEAGAQRAAAQAFVDYLASPRGREAVAASGLQPLP
jgi:molybdate transport system substrate-binding protein